jgi:hypothetical protein
MRNNSRVTRKFRSRHNKENEVSPFLSVESLSILRFAALLSGFIIEANESVLVYHLTGIVLLASYFHLLR